MTSQYTQPATTTRDRTGARSRVYLLLRVLVMLAVLVFMVLLTTCTRRPDAMTQAERSGVLRVATLNSASTYYLGADQPKGLEYDLARGFAKTLGVRLEMVIVPDRAAVIRAVKRGRAQIGAGVAISPSRKKQVRFTPAYLSAKLETIYKIGTHKPEKLADLSGRLILPDQSILAEWLHAHKPHIKFTVDRDANTEELLARISKSKSKSKSNGKGKITAAYADMAAINQRYYPNLRVGFTLKHPRKRLAWAFPRTHRKSNDLLYDKAVAYLQQARESGRIKVLKNRYFGHSGQLGFAGGAEFAHQIRKRLAHWEPDFKAAAKKYGLNWRLLAAMAYQESRLDPNATSPTQVRGIMMLTRETAAHIGVKNRLDPKQAIDGGARYLVALRKQLPKAVKPPDRTWFALAAYNLGLGHVLDARRLLKRAGRNPNLWINLREALGWLEEKRHLGHTRFGYAPGKQAVTYVSNIRAYDDILTWMGKKKRQAASAADEQAQLTDQTGSKNKRLPLFIPSPAL